MTPLHPPEQWDSMPGISLGQLVKSWKPGTFKFYEPMNFLSLLRSVRIVILPFLSLLTATGTEKRPLDLMIETIGLGEDDSSAGALEKSG